MYKLIITEIGDELGIILPAELAERLNAIGRTELIADETETGIILRPYDPSSPDRS